MANVESTLSHESSPPEPVDDNPSTPIAALGRIWKQLLAQWGTDNTEPERSGALDEARGKSIVTVMPVMTRLNGGRQLRIPREAGYDGELFEVGALG